MKELHEEETFGMTSHAFKSGDLKMVKVRRGKRGHRQSRSLVFRISRSSKAISDDSGIKCISTEEEISSGEEQIKPPPSTLKIRIPKSALQDGTERDETSAINSVSPEDLMLQSNNLLDEKQRKDIFSAKMNVSADRMEGPNLKEDILNTSTGILCANSGILNADSKQTADETKSCDLRRSSRRILLRVQKDCQSDFSVNKTSIVDHKFPFASPTREEANTQAPLGEKRKRGRKPGNRECKKRKYGRRGRPPKSQIPKHISLVKPVISGGVPNEKLVFVPPPKNSVWTLVPKELFESEFFKSQLLKVRLSNSAENGIKTNYGMSSPTSQIHTKPTSSQKQFKIPIINVSNISDNREKTLEEKDPKRPTVIYFKTEKKKYDYSQNQKGAKNPQMLMPNEVSKTQNDLLYLFNKYRMLEDIILKNHYELAGGNLNEAESMLSNFLSSSNSELQEENGPGICESQVNPLNCLDLELSSGDRPSCPVTGLLSPSSEPTLDDVDTLSRKMIVQSLQILFSEEAVLI